MNQWGEYSESVLHSLEARASLVAISQTHTAHWSEIVRSNVDSKGSKRSERPPDRGPSTLHIDPLTCVVESTVFPSLLLSLGASFQNTVIGRRLPGMLQINGRAGSGDPCCQPKELSWRHCSRCKFWMRLSSKIQRLDRKCVEMQQHVWRTVVTKKVSNRIEHLRQSRELSPES